MGKFSPMALQKCKSLGVWDGHIRTLGVRDGDIKSYEALNLFLLIKNTTINLLPAVTSWVGMGVEVEVEGGIVRGENW